MFMMSPWGADGMSPEEEYEKRLLEISEKLFNTLSISDDAVGMAAAEQALAPLSAGERQRVLEHIIDLDRRYPSNDPGKDRPRLVRLSIENLIGKRPWWATAIKIGAGAAILGGLFFVGRRIIKE